MKEINELICEALEIPIVKDGSKKLPVEEIVIENYDKITGYAGRARKPMVDWITEYNYVSEKNLNKEEYDKLLEEKGYQPTGMIEYKKKKLTMGNGKVYYLHQCIATMF